MNTIIEEFDTLTPEEQQLALDFIKVLKRKRIAGRVKPPSRQKLADEPFIGMWKDRQDMEDSTAWVRQTRKNEWSRRVG